MRVLELFAGIGACSKALERIGIDLEIVDAVEIDKYAMASFNAIHNTNFETQDITTWNKDLKDIDLITHGSPCQDFSVAGKQAGGDLGSGTRSSLMYETIRIVGQVRPKYVLWENVKNILSKKHKHNFDAYIETMNVLGYNSYYQVLNAKDYGIPQNRERVYTVSIRKDIDKGDLKFPEKEKLKLKLKDMLESEVEEKYYISKALNLKLTNNYIQYSNSGKMQNSQAERAYYKDNEYMCTVSHCNLNGDKTQIVLKNKKEIYGINKIEIPQIVKVRKYKVDIERLKETLRNHKNITNKEIAQKLNKPLTLVEHWFRTDDSFSIPDAEIWFKLKNLLNINTDEFDKAIITFEEKIGVYEKTNRYYLDNGIAPTITQQEEKIIIKNATNIDYRIRKLTPKECWRLMGFDDEDFEKAKNVPTSNTQLYKQARKLNLRISIRKNI